jgi:hypothetical protein
MKAVLDCGDLGLGVLGTFWSTSRLFSAIFVRRFLGRELQPSEMGEI